MLTVGDKAPAFTAQSTDGEVGLAELLSQGSVVLYFFPKALTSGCALEAVEFNQLLLEFEGIGVRVIAVSVDGLERLERFREKYSLAFPLVSDSDRAIGDAYGTLKAPGGSNERDTVVISPDGTILAAYRRARAAGHAANVLAAAKDLKAQGSL